MKRISGLSVGLVAVAWALAVVPANANVTIRGCTIVAHPSPNHHTDCPGDDLGGADLGAANLSYANLARDNLVGANLGGANLSYANLSSANLTGSDLTPDNFSYATLAGANLGGDDLSGDSFHGANLARANLARANLAGSDLRCARLNGTGLAGANLGGANRGCAVATPHVTHCGPRGSFLRRGPKNDPSLPTGDVRARNMKCSAARTAIHKGTFTFLGDCYGRLQTPGPCRDGFHTPGFRCRPGPAPRGGVRCTAGRREFSFHVNI